MTVKNGRRSIIYVDGFNFYRGLIKGTKNKWLDLQRFFEIIRAGGNQDGDDIQKIKYFTAKVWDKNRASRQEAYLKALRTKPLIEIFLGRYQNKSIECVVSGCKYKKSRYFEVPEEKLTDVSIGIEMVKDAYEGLCDRMVLVSGDSDLVPPIKMIRERFEKITITVYIPAKDYTKISDPVERQEAKIRGAARDLRQTAHKNHRVPETFLHIAQFPERFKNSAGEQVARPIEWS